jgi:hypothetical protein
MEYYKYLPMVDIHNMEYYKYLPMVNIHNMEYFKYVIEVENILGEHFSKLRLAVFG